MPGSSEFDAMVEKWKAKAERFDAMVEEYAKAKGEASELQRQLDAVIKSADTANARLSFYE